MTIPTPLSLQVVSASAFGKAVADKLNADKAKVATTNVSGIAASDVTLSAVSDTVFVVSGSPYLVTAWCPVRYGLAGASIVAMKLKAGASTIIEARESRDFTGNEKFTMFGQTIWTPGTTSTTFTLTLNTTGSTVQTNNDAAGLAPYGWTIRPIELA